MAGKNERLRQWWEALNEQERASAMRFKERGDLDPGTLASLQSAGLVPRAKPQPLPRDVSEFLKMRH